MKRARPSFASFVMLLAAFIALASHVGMFDHSSHLMASASEITASESMRSGSSDAMQHSVPMSEPSTPTGPHRTPADSTMSMVCQLFALLAVVGVALRRLVFTTRHRKARRSDSKPSTLAVARLSLLPARPPGLTMLCVARC